VTEVKVHTDVAELSRAACLPYRGTANFKRPDLEPEFDLQTVPRDGELIEARWCFLEIVSKPQDPGTLSPIGC